MSKNNWTRFWLVITLLLAGLFLAACGSTEPAADEEVEHMDDMAHDDGEHEEVHDPNEVHMRIPNEDGAAISITSPQEGDTFKTLDQIIVEIEVENFELGGNNHWHVYVDGTSYGMVMGGNTDQPLPGLEPGEHEISVFLSIDTHEEYEDGDSITVVVEE
ncbi:MAG: hypothetical protein H6654_05250 [Ardenticatenaceae bacterium]|nr:hypothetical protein [Anaerolineales bacterium]MCB8941831.1 hypothetical protein [Ardenticatenaceae bacterium]MCB8972945.1 hypothetical protein [Ardenticatenaceae bacterium]